jgi:predicted CoA-binding protein
MASADTAAPEPYLKPDPELRSLLGAAKTIAVVGLSTRPTRPSNQVAAYLQRHGYRIVPVNPYVDEVLGERAYPSLLGIPDDIRVDVVDVFRRAEFTPEVAGQAVAIGAKLLWLQADIVSDEARRIAEAGGLEVVMGVCLRMELRRLGV